jgi:hypothetical protein
MSVNHTGVDTVPGMDSHRQTARQYGTHTLLVDWWAFGSFRYGDRLQIVNSPDWHGPSYQTCRHAAVVSRAFDPDRRRTTLTFEHHRTVAALSQNDADHLLEWALAHERPKTIRELRDKIKCMRIERATQPVEGTSATTEELDREFEATWSRLIHGFFKLFRVNDREIIIDKMIEWLSDHRQEMVEPPSHPLHTNDRASSQDRPSQSRFAGSKPPSSHQW